jgi:hypothetical protein
MQQLRRILSGGKMTNKNIIQQLRRILSDGKIIIIQQLRRILNGKMMMMMIIYNLMLMNGKIMKGR